MKAFKLFAALIILIALGVFAIVGLMPVNVETQTVQVTLSVSEILDRES